MHRDAHGWEPPLTTKTATFAGCLDYIWLSSTPPSKTPLRPHEDLLGGIKATTAQASSDSPDFIRESQCTSSASSKGEDKGEESSSKKDRPFSIFSRNNITGSSRPLRDKKTSKASDAKAAPRHQDHFKVLQTLGLPYLMPSTMAQKQAGSTRGQPYLMDPERVVEGSAAVFCPSLISTTATAVREPPPPRGGGLVFLRSGTQTPLWIDPMQDVDFPPIPNETFPSDHLAMG